MKCRAIVLFFYNYKIVKAFCCCKNRLEELALLNIMKLSRTYNTSLSSQLSNGPSKLVCLVLESLSSLVKINTLADWAHWKVKNKVWCYKWAD
jgi:hypothetical protein